MQRGTTVGIECATQHGLPKLMVGRTDGGHEPQKNTGLAPGVWLHLFGWTTSTWQGPPAVWSGKKVGIVAVVVVVVVVVVRSCIIVKRIMMLHYSILTPILAQGSSIRALTYTTQVRSGGSQVFV